jgi:Pathogenicity locus
MAARPQLDLSDAERRALRRSRVSLSSLPELEAHELERLTDLPVGRCRELIALAGLQRLGSIGPSLARDLWALGIRSPEDLDGRNPRALYERFERMVGQRVDPCVEDTFRCAVAQASIPDLPEELRQWWMWTDQRGLPSVGLPQRS